MAIIDTFVKLIVSMVTLERSLAHLVRERIIERETAFRHAADPKALAHLLD